MKPEHLEQLRQRLPDAIHKINQLLSDNGLDEFRVKSLEIRHEDDDPCGGTCGENEICDQKLVDHIWIPYCRPRTFGDSDN